jgi:Methyltransferase domain/Putative zinc binding domain/C-methyltransferase C-terminal domain
MNEINKCEVCDLDGLVKVLDLGFQPMCDDLISIGYEKICTEYPIEILFCKNCLTAHQRFQVPKKELFKKNYHYRAKLTNSVLTCMVNLVDSCIERFGSVKGKTVLDIGCNDGSLLDFFREKGAITVGIEPTDAAKDSKHFIINSFFDSVSAKEVLNRIGKPDFITFTNVFAHIEDLNQLLKNLMSLIDEHTVVIIENHYLGAILQYGQFDTFYHEHQRTYSLTSFKFIASKLNLKLTDIKFMNRDGGNIRVFISSHDSLNVIETNENSFIDKFIKMNSSMLIWQKNTKVKVANLVKLYGKLPAVAFPGRATILINLLNLNEDQIEAVYEIKGSIKVGHYVPGTRIPILPELELFSKHRPKKIPVINFAWHIPNEVRANLASNNVNNLVIDLKDFVPELL